MATNLILEQMLSCPICQEIFTEPIALSCLHTLCKCCIDNLKKYPKGGKAIECPVCRDRTEVSFLKKDFRTQSLIDIINHQPTFPLDKQFVNSCQLCHKRNIMCKCSDCDKLMCHDCGESHQSIPLCSKHTIKSIEELAEEGIIQAKRIAQKLKSDKVHLDQKLQQICSYSEHLDTVKAHAQEMIIQSENYFIEHVKRKHRAMLEKLDQVIARQRSQLEVYKCSFIECGCKLETATQCLKNVVSQKIAAPALVANLGVLKDIDIHDTDPCGMFFDFKYLDLKLQISEPKSLEVKLEIHTTDKPCNFEEKLVQFQHQQIKIENKTDTNPIAMSSTVCDNPVLVYPDEEAKLQYCDHLLMILDDIQYKVLNKENQSWHTTGNVRGMADASMNDQSNKRIKPIHLLSELQTHKLQKCGEIHIDKLDCPVKIKAIGEEIWCLCKSKIEIFDLAGCPIRTISHRNIQNARSLTRAFNGDVFVASESEGLVLVNSSKPYHCILSGSFCDIASDLETICALEHKKCSVIFYKFDVQQGRRGGDSAQSKWSVCFEVQRPDIPSLDDTLLVKDGNIYVGSYRGDCILIFNQEGKCLASVGKSGKNLGELWRPRLCYVDKEGTLLVSDFYNNRLQILDNNHRWHGVEIMETLNFPWDGFLHSRTGLLVLQNCNIHNKILRFGKV